MQVTCHPLDLQTKLLKLLKREVKQPHIVGLENQKTALFQQPFVFRQIISVGQTSLRMSCLGPRITEIQIENVNGEYYFKMDLSKYINEKPDDSMVEGVDYLGNYELNFDTWELECTSYYKLDNGIEGLQSSTFAKYDSNGLNPTGSNTELQNEFLTTVMEEQDIDEKTVTLNCLHGDSLDLSKISIQVTCKDRFGEYVIKTPRNTYSGTLSAGDTKKLQLADDPNLWKIYEGIEVDITIFYGDYVLVTEEKMTVSWDYR